MNAVGKSVTGLLRKNNEDSIFVSDNNFRLKNVYIVADGMGGHKAGEIASKCSIDIFTDFINCCDENEFEDENILDTSVDGVKKCNSIVFKKSNEDEKLDGMGTTFTCAVIKDEIMYVVHVGDSRVYMLRNGILKQLTKDHSFVMEMLKQGKLTIDEVKNHPNKNVITRAVGSDENVAVDTAIEKLQKGDIILLCTDGLTNMINDNVITDILNSGNDADSILDQLISSANEMGGIDNISAIIIDMR